MSMEQPKHQHPLDKRLQTVIDEQQHFYSIEQQDPVFTEILDLRAALLRSYDEYDYETNLKALEAKAASLYREIDAGLSLIASVLNTINPDHVQLERQAKIRALRVAIDEDKKTIRNYLDSTPEMRIAYMIGVAERLSPEVHDNFDELIELNSKIESLYESIAEQSKNVRTLYPINGKIHDARLKEIYQKFHQEIGALQERNKNNFEEQSEASEVSKADANPVQKPVDLYKAEVQRLQMEYSYAIELYIRALENQIEAIDTDNIQALNFLNSYIDECEANIAKVEQEYEKLLHDHGVEYHDGDGKRELENEFPEFALKLQDTMMRSLEAQKKYTFVQSDLLKPRPHNDANKAVDFSNPLFDEQEARRLEEENKSEEEVRLEEEDHKLEKEERRLEAQVHSLEQEIDALKEEHIHSKSLPPTPIKLFKTKEQALKKVDEKLNDIDERMRGIANNIGKVADETARARDLIFYFEAQKERDLYNKIKEYISASETDRVQIKNEIDKLLDDLTHYYSKNTEIYTGVLDAAGKEAPIHDQIEAEIANKLKEIEPYLRVVPLLDAYKSEQVVQSLTADEGLGVPSPPTPEKKSHLMTKVKASSVPPAPKEEEKIMMKTSVQTELTQDEGVNTIICAQKEQAKSILKNLSITKSELFTNKPEKISADNARKIHEAVLPLLKFIQDNRNNKDLVAEVNAMRTEVADMQSKLKQYLKASSTFERTITRAPSAVKKVFSDKLSSRHIIENTKNEIKAVTNEASRFHHMHKRR